MGKKYSIKKQDGLLGHGPATYYADKQKNQNVKYSIGAKLDEPDFNGNLA